MILKTKQLLVHFIYNDGLEDEVCTLNQAHH